MSKGKRIKNPVIAPGYALNAISKATKIPVPTLRKIESGKATPSKNSVNKIQNYYRREQYKIAREIFKDSRVDAKKVSRLAPHKFDLYTTARKILPPRESKELVNLPPKEFSNHLELRKNGAMREQAENDRDLPKAEVKKIAGDIRAMAKIIAKNNGVPLKHILKGMRMSDRTNDDWEQYIKERNNVAWRPQRKIYDKPHNAENIDESGLYEYFPENSDNYNEWMERVEAGFYD
jgi:transcriptional regulator with XRE-family HTH domain